MYTCWENSRKEFDLLVVVLIVKGYDTLRCKEIFIILRPSGALNRIWFCVPNFEEKELVFEILFFFKTLSAILSS